LKAFIIIIVPDGSQDTRLYHPHSLDKDYSFVDKVSKHHILISHLSRFDPRRTLSNNYPCLLLIFIPQK